MELGPKPMFNPGSLGPLNSPNAQLSESDSGGFGQDLGPLTAGGFPLMLAIGLIRLTLLLIGLKMYPFIIMDPVGLKDIRTMSQVRVGLVGRKAIMDST